MTENESIEREKAQGLRLLEELLIGFGAVDGASHLSDTPIRTNVWLAFAEEPGKPQNLLVEPNHFVRSANVMAAMWDGIESFNSGETRLESEETELTLELSSPPPKDPFEPGKRKPIFMALGNTILARLDMVVLISIVFPMTVWFQRLTKSEVDDFYENYLQVVKGGGDLISLNDLLRRTKRPALWRFLVTWVVIRTAAGMARENYPELERWRYISDTCKMLLSITSPQLRRDYKGEAATQLYSDVHEFFAGLHRDYGGSLEKLVERAKKPKGEDFKTAPVWSVDLNRPADLAASHSRKTVKVDAAENVFRIPTSGIRWAILDTGIDATHPAFRKPVAVEKTGEAKELTGADDKAAKKDVPPVNPKQANEYKALVTTRIRSSYDFNRLKKLYLDDVENLLTMPEEHAIADTLGEGSLRRGVIRYLYACHELHRREEAWDSEKFHDAMDWAKHQLTSILQDKVRDGSGTTFSDRVTENFRKVTEAMTQGATLNWEILEPLLRVAHLPGLYPVPKNGHGTHVAGILGGNLSDEVLVKDLEFEDDTKGAMGMCPDISLYDIRVLDDHGQSDEFVVMSAMQFIAYLNTTRDRPVIHGANLSLQIQHMVSNYGCGQTPVCRAANRLVDSGVCVVVAAGNQGFQNLQSAAGYSVASYATSSIMDPGNADKVITVGSTHAESPHSNGVSYFSSRGPTADGREKPDIIAPGERILGPWPEAQMREESGTSMACPHVSGAAALILARHNEFMDKPLEIKRILMETATDLGRRREFQGAGLLDVLRALESV